MFSRLLYALLLSVLTLLQAMPLYAGEQAPPATTSTPVTAPVKLQIGANTGAKIPDQAPEELKLHGLFSDHMILQREREVPVWGWAKPGSAVKISFEGNDTVVPVDADGNWQAKLPPQPGGGPSRLIVASEGKTITVEDILFGEVWVGSGQSNMWWPVEKSADAQYEVSGAKYPHIRFFTVDAKVAEKPLRNLQGQWEPCSPQTVARFSACCFFFGRELGRHLDVPIGLIHSSVGGTAIESWIPRQGFENDPYFAPLLQSADRSAKSYSGAFDLFRKDMREWEKKHAPAWGANPLQAKGWHLPEFPFVKEGWKSIRLPGFWENADAPELTGLDGIVWLRREIALPENWAGRELTLELGTIDDCDMTYFNGALVGATGIETEDYWGVKRKYQIPAGVVQKGENAIITRVFDQSGSGGIRGTAADFRIYPSNETAAAIPLTGFWRFKIEQRFDKNVGASRPTAPFKPGTSGFPSALYNGMIAPLQPFAIRGVLWYQGESNTGNPGTYRKLFPALIRSWRQSWKEGDFPFLYVQLANFTRHTPNRPVQDNERPTEPQDSNWARLREAQTAMLNLPHTGMVVTTDIGESEDIHPKNKQEVGKRLALSARKVAYKEKLVDSGPLCMEMKAEPGRVVLEFNNVGTGLMAKGEELKWFEIAGADRRFVRAKAVIEGDDKVIVSAPEVKEPVAVRYAWADDPAGCNLYNQEGLPASPFRTDDW